MAAKRDALVTAAALHSGLPCVFIRNQKKDYGTAQQLEGRLEAGDGVEVCAGESVTLTGSTPSSCASGILSYRWSDASGVICDWSGQPDCQVAPTTTTTTEPVSRSTWRLPTGDATLGYAIRGRAA